MSTTVKPGHRWALRLANGRAIPRRVACRAKSVHPAVIEEALGVATCRPSPHSKLCAFGYDADGRLCLTFVSDLSSLVGDDLAAARWLSGAPRAEWTQVPIDQENSR